MEERGMVSNNGTPYGMGGVSIRRGLSFQSRRERVGGGGVLVQVSNGSLNRIVRQ